jgi:methionyl-tRNA synthetase
MAMMVSPLVPRAAQELWRRLGLEGEVGRQTYPEQGRWGLLPAGTKVETGTPLFPRIEEEASA